jgi:hypothetical protein
MEIAVIEPRSHPLSQGASAAVRAVCRAEDRMRAAFGTSLRDDPGTAFVRSGLFAVVVPGGAPRAKINPP